MKKLVLTMMVLGMGMMAVPAHADMTYAPSIFDAQNASGSAIADGTYAMIIDLDGDGWNGNSYLSNALSGDNSLSWLWDSDDFLMDVGQIGFPAPGIGSPFKTIATSEIPTTYNAGVDQFYLLWFDKPFQLGAAGPGNGIDYGAESLGFVGTNPGDYTPFAVGGLANLRTLGTTEVPEPISAVLALIGGGAMALRRRFGRIAV